MIRNLTGMVDDGTNGYRTIQVIVSNNMRQNEIGAIGEISRAWSPMARMDIDFDVRLRRFRHAQVVGDVIFAQFVSITLRRS